MIDIWMCLDKQCPQRETCFRYKTEPDSYRQAYFGKSPRVNGECAYYVSLLEAELKDKR